MHGAIPLDVRHKSICRATTLRVARQASAVVAWLLELEEAQLAIHRAAYPIQLSSFADLERKEYHRIGRGRARYPSSNGGARWRWRPSASPWMEYLTEEATNEPGTLLYDEFRRQFRVPKCMFDGFLDDMRADGRFLDENNHPGSGPKPHPLALKLMAVLRAMALGVPIDGVADTARISVSVINNFFNEWLSWFNETYYDKWVRIPETEEELRMMEQLFAKCGLPGCLTSMDVVHLHGERLPAGNRSDYVGKEGFPTVAFQCHCTHNTRLVYIGPMQPGARNDKTIVQFDMFVKKVREDPLYKDLTFEVLDANGEPVLVKGAWVLCDGGYHHWRSTICAPKHGCTFHQRVFAQTCESVRKDIERVFGILKRRWRILRVPIGLQTELAISHLFRTCGILHNMLLDFDGADQHGFDDEDWIAVDLESTYQTFIREGRKIDNLPVINADFLRRGSQAINNEPCEQEAGFQVLRDALMVHMMMLKDKGELLWLSTRH